MIFTTPWVDEHYGELSPMHTVNNALVVIGAMIYGRMDGGTCGSIVGAASGAKGLTSSLVAPLNDTIKPRVFGFEEVAMAELAMRTLSVHRKIAGLS